MNLCSTNATEGENASIQGYSHCLEVSSILLAVFGVKGFFLKKNYYNETQTYSFGNQGKTILSSSALVGSSH